MLAHAVNPGVVDCDVAADRSVRSSAHSTIAALLASHTHEPTGKRGHRVEQQEHLDTRALASEAAFTSLPVAMGFQIAVRQLDLHAPPADRGQPACTEGQRGRATNHRGSLSRFAF